MSDTQALNNKDYAYYFDGKGILINEEPKFDQYFDDRFLPSNKNYKPSYTKNSYNESIKNTKSIEILKKSSEHDKVLKNDLTHKYSKDFDEYSLKNNNDSYLINNTNNNEYNDGNISNNLINKDFKLNTNNFQNINAQEVYNTLKDHYYKTKGIPEIKSEPLFQMYLDYKKNYYNKNKKVPISISKIINLDNMYIKSCLEDISQQVQNSLNKKLTSNKFNNQQNSKYLSRETLKRLFKDLKDNEIYNVKDYNKFPKFFERLVYHYNYKNSNNLTNENNKKTDLTNNSSFNNFNRSNKITNNNNNNNFFKSNQINNIDCFTNDDKILFDFWTNLPDSEKKDFFLEYDAGDNSLEAELSNFLSDETIIDRLISLYESVRGFKTYHPRPLYDYWNTQMSIPERYLKGLYKHNADVLFELLSNRYEQEKEEKIKEKQLNDELLKLGEDEREKNKRIDALKYKKILIRINELSDPNKIRNKRWKRGRVLLNLKKRFIYDNILAKMINIEFKNNRRFKLPDEYLNYDSEEEDKLLFKNKNKGKELIQMTNNDLKKIQEKTLDNIQQVKLKEDIILKEIEDNILKENKEDKQLELYLREEVKKYYKRFLNFNKNNNDNTIDNHKNNEIDNIKHNSLDNNYKHPSLYNKNKTIRHIYSYIKKTYKKATERRFPLNIYGKAVFRNKINKTKKNRLKNNNYYFPKSLKYYFNKLLNRLFVDGEGNIIYTKLDEMPFWAPIGSNTCKVHLDSMCPIYCYFKSNNKNIMDQKINNFKTYLYNDSNKLLQDEKLHLWKRKDLKNIKEQIFLCFDEVEHCTFEPKLISKLYKKDEVNRINNLELEEVALKRISNKAWVDKMGKNYKDRNHLIFKEGIVKKAKVQYNNGNFSECKKLLTTAFNIEEIKIHFDTKYAQLVEKNRKKKAIEDLKLGKNPADVESNIFKNRYWDNKEGPYPDNFNKAKNKEICRDVFIMINDIDNYYKSQKKEAKKLKDELLLIKTVKKNPTIINKISDKTFVAEEDLFQISKNIITGKKSSLLCTTNDNNQLNNHSLVQDIQSNITQSTNVKTNITLKINQFDNTTGNFSLTIHETNYINDRYFKKFKSIMCPLKKECPYDIRPRWPHSDLKANTPFGINCPYAHHISEIKFEDEITERIKLKSKNLAELAKNKDPINTYNKEFIPSGELKDCNGCGFKGCTFCKFVKLNKDANLREREKANITNKQIIDKINNKSDRQDLLDQSFEYKFGILKKATILYNFRRYIDAINLILKAKEAVENENKENNDKYDDLDQKWRKKLGIININIPRDILNYEINEYTLNYFKIENVQLSTILVYADKMRKGNDFSFLNRHTYINNQIIEFYNKINKVISSYNNDIKTVKSQIKDLNDWIEYTNNKRNNTFNNKHVNATNSSNLQTSNPRLYNKMTKKYKIKMCDNAINNKSNKCNYKYSHCKFAHNPNNLNLTQPKTELFLLNKNLSLIKNKKVESKTIVPFIPPKKNTYEVSKLIII